MTAAQPHTKQLRLLFVGPNLMSDENRYTVTGRADGDGLTRFPQEPVNV